MSMFQFGNTDNAGISQVNLGTSTLNVDNNNINSDNQNNVTNTKKGIVLNRSNKNRDKSEEMQTIQKNIDNSLGLNKDEIVNPIEMNIKNTLFFRLHVSGIIESANFYDGDAIYCKYDFVHGTDWEKEDGQVSGQSQFACKGEGTFDYFVWNMPFECSFRSLNPSGWPQLVVTCVYPDFLGREVIKGYGVVHVPITPGRHERTVHMFSPVTSSLLLKFFGFLVGQRAEIINAPKVVASGEGREITRTKTEGSVKIVFQVTLRDMDKFGYNV